MTEGNTERRVKVSTVRTVGVGDHVMYPQTLSEPGKPGCVLRRVTGGGGDRGDTGGSALCVVGWRIGV